MARAKSKKPATPHPNDALWREVIAETRLLADTLRDGGVPAVEKTFRVTRLPQPHPTRDTPVRDHIQRLRAAITNFAKQREVAEAKCAEVDPVVRQLGRAQMVEPGYQVTGEVVQQHDHPGTEAMTFALAAIKVPDGVGAVRFTLEHIDQVAEEVPWSFVPFASCEPAVQAALAPHIDGLLAELVRGLDLSSVG